MELEAAVQTYFKEHKVHGLVDEMLKSAVGKRPEDLKSFWHQWLGDEIKKEISFKALIFDLDGVITKTAAVHSRAWKAMFDAYLKEKTGEDFKEFTSEDYLKYVDGKPRYDGVEAFMQSRGITLPKGDPSDPPDQEEVTYCSLGNRKNDFFVGVLEKEGVEEYPSTVRIMRKARELGIRVGVASSSKNARKVLETAELMGLVEERVDGVVSAELGLKGKPAGDIFVTCCKKLGVEPQDAIVVEDATSGVAAGRDGKFRLVIGLAREDNQEDLKAHGAHVVVDDFGDATLLTINRWFNEQPKP